MHGTLQRHSQRHSQTDDQMRERWAAITLTGSLDAEGGTVSGRWRESTYAMQGAATGVTEAGSVRLKISGGATGSLTLNVVGTSHSVALSATGATLRAVNIALHRN